MAQEKKIKIEYAVVRREMLPPITINVEVVDGVSYIIPPWEDAFIEAIKICASIRQACEIAGISRPTYQTHKEYSPPFKARVEHARQDAYDAMYEEAWDRAKNGRERPIFFQGEQVGSVTEYSDNLMALILKGIKPETFGNKVDITSGGESLVKPQVFLPQIEDGNTVDSKAVDENKKE